MWIITTIAVIKLLIGVSDTANILLVMIWPGQSHYLMLKPIGFELARRGHNVTAITPLKETVHPKNYHQIVVSDKTVFDKQNDGSKINPFSLVDWSDEEGHERILWQGGLDLTEMALNSTHVKKFFAEDHKFDLVISEQFYQEAFYVLSHKYKAPLVLITPFGNCMRHNIITRNPLQLATTYSEFLKVTSTESFLSRLHNFYFTVYEYFWWNFSYMEKQSMLVTKYIQNLPQPVPSLYDIQKNTSLFLMNRHFAFENPVAYGPNSIEIGGIHLVEDSTDIPADLQKILNESTNGVVYLSFGTVLSFTDLPFEKMNAFLSVFGQLKQTVLLKVDKKKLKYIPANVVAKKWFPQKKVLAHPNVKVFIHHGGIFGVQEAVTYGVPILGLPVFGDQYRNIFQIEHIGMGKMLRHHDINEENLERMLKEIIENESYRNNAQEVSKRFNDRPMGALDTAMYWIEFVIRHKGADYIKNRARNLSWVTYNLFDIYLFILTISIGIVFGIRKIISIANRFIRDDGCKLSIRRKLIKYE